MAKTTSRIATYEMQHRFDFFVQDCGECGVIFAVPTSFNQRRRSDGQTFYCPNGHRRVYQVTDVQRERKARERAEARLTRERAEADRLRADRDHQRRRVAAAKGQATKVRKRIAAGVCPCCSRSFQNLHKHMAGQHPGYVEGPEA